MEQPLGEKISFNQFKKETKDKKAKFVWTPRTTNNKAGKSFETEKFFIKKFGQGNYRGVSMPKLKIWAIPKFYKLNETNYHSVSQYGVIFYRVFA